jgi:hypothetical protein
MLTVQLLLAPRGRAGGTGCLETSLAKPGTRVEETRGPHAHPKHFLTQSTLQTQVAAGNLSISETKRMAVGPLLLPGRDGTWQLFPFCLALQALAGSCEHQDEKKHSGWRSLGNCP